MPLQVRFVPAALLSWVSLERLTLTWLWTSSLRKGNEMTIEELEHYKEIYEKHNVSKDATKQSLLLKNDVNNSKQLRSGGYLELNTLNYRLEIKDQTIAGLIMDYLVKLCQENEDNLKKEFESL
nr:MAG TPA: hypothetical protein [Caudoviricetes sp.]